MGKIPWHSLQWKRFPFPCNRDSVILPRKGILCYPNFYLLQSCKFCKSLTPVRSNRTTTELLAMLPPPWSGDFGANTFRNEVKLVQERCEIGGDGQIHVFGGLRNFQRNGSCVGGLLDSRRNLGAPSCLNRGTDDKILLSKGCCRSLTFLLERQRGCSFEQKDLSWSTISLPRSRRWSCLHLFNAVFSVLLHNTLDVTADLEAHQTKTIWSVPYSYGHSPAFSNEKTCNV